MKRIMFLLMAVLMSIGTSTFAGTKTEGSKAANTQKFSIP